jgi:hypothetical protein
MLTIFKIKQGDRRPYLYATLGPIDEDGEVVAQPLTDAVVTFNMRDAEGNVVIDHGDVAIDDEDAGEVHYAWQTGDTDVPGEYYGEFQARYGTEQETFPNDRIGFRILITEQIA